MSLDKLITSFIFAFRIALRVDLINSRAMNTDFIYCQFWLYIRSQGKKTEK